MLKLYIAYVTLEYVSFVWSPQKLKDIEMLERVQHFAPKNIPQTVVWALFRETGICGIANPVVSQELRQSYSPV